MYVWCVCSTFSHLGLSQFLLYSWVSFCDEVKRKALADARIVLITLAPKHSHAKKDGQASLCSVVRFLTWSPPGGRSSLVSAHRFRRKALFPQTICTRQFVDCGLFPIARIGCQMGGRAGGCYTRGLGVGSQKANEGWINPLAPLVEVFGKGHKARFGYPLLLTLFMCCRTLIKNRAVFPSPPRWVTSKPRVEPEVCMAPFLILMRICRKRFPNPFGTHRVIISNVRFECTKSINK